MRENGRRLLLGKTSWQNLRHTMNSYPSNTSNQANNSRANPEGKSQRLGRMASYCIEHAKSGRATCKGCKAKIEQGALRLGTTTPGPGDYDMTSWRHLDCVKKLKGLSGLDAVRGVSSLQPADQAKVQAWYAALSSGVGSGKKGFSRGDARIHPEMCAPFTKVLRCIRAGCSLWRAVTRRSPRGAPPA